MAWEQVPPRRPLTGKQAALIRPERGADPFRQGLSGPAGRELQTGRTDQTGIGGEAATILPRLP
jgi:hypothetical protein